MKSISPFLALSLISSLALLSAQPQVCNFPAIFNFGDSNSDTGSVSAVFGEVGPPHGESFFGGPAGRYCDGRHLIDFIAEGLRLPYLSAFLDSMGTNYSHGVNFAIGGATIRSLDSVPRNGGLSRISFGVQFTQFSKFKSRSQIFRNRSEVLRSSLPEADYFSRGLYTIEFGPNDLTAGLAAKKSVQQVHDEIPDIISYYKKQIQKIYEQGGRYFWIHTMAPIGCLPYVIKNLGGTNPNFDAIGCVVPFNELAQHLNKVLKEAVTELRNTLPEAAITYVDTYSIKYELFTNPTKHGFTTSLAACCGHGGGKYNYDGGALCGTRGVVNGTDVYIGKPCKDPTKAIVWDGAHLTQAANKFIFDKISNGEFTDPPVALNMSCHRQ